MINIICSPSHPARGWYNFTAAIPSHNNLSTTFIYRKFFRDLRIASTLFFYSASSDVNHYMLMMLGKKGKKNILQVLFKSLHERDHEAIEDNWSSRKWDASAETFHDINIIIPSHKNYILSHLKSNNSRLLTWANSSRLFNIKCLIMSNVLIPVPLWWQLQWQFKIEATSSVSPSKLLSAVIGDSTLSIILQSNCAHETLFEFNVKLSLVESCPIQHRHCYP